MFNTLYTFATFDLLTLKYIQIIYAPLCNYIKWLHASVVRPLNLQLKVTSLTPDLSRTGKE